MKSNFYHIEDQESPIVAKCVTLKFLGDAAWVRRRALHDLEVSYYAEPIVYLFQQLSQLFYGIISRITSAYLFYQFYLKPREKRAREILEDKIREILKEHEKKN